MQIDEYNEAGNDSWIDKQRLSELDEMEQRLVKHLKITYMCGIGNNHLVPIFIPPDTMPSLIKLADPHVRYEVNVLKSNTYLFAGTKLSEGHTSGWHAVHNITNNLRLKKPENIKATSNRHRVLFSQPVIEYSFLSPSSSTLFSARHRVLFSQPVIEYSFLSSFI